MALVKQLWSLNALETEIGRDRRTIGKALKGVPVDGKIGGRDAWHLTTVLAALDRHDYPHGRESGSLDPAQERARKDRALAISAEIKNDIATSKVVLIEAVGSRVATDYSIVRERILTIPGKLSHSLNQEQARELEQEIDEALAELHAPAEADDVFGWTEGRGKDSA